MMKNLLSISTVLCIVLLMHASSMEGNAKPLQPVPTPTPHRDSRDAMFMTPTPTPTQTSAPQESGVRPMAPNVTVIPIIDDIDIPEGLFGPYPDAPTNPLLFNGYWYNYVSGQASDLTMSTAVHKLGNGESYGSLSVDFPGSLVRVNPAATPASAPKWVFQAQEPFIVNTPIPTIANPGAKWFSRMGIITGHVNENNTKVHAIFHAEDTHTSPADLPPPGTFNGFKDEIHRDYARIGLVSSTDPENFSVNNAKLLLECFMDEDGWRSHHETDDMYEHHNDGVGGIRHPWTIEASIGGADYVYVFYDRIISALWRDANSVPSEAFTLSTFTANPNVSEICVARAERTAFLNFANGETSTNPFKKFFFVSFDEPQ